MAELVVAFVGMALLDAVVYSQPQGHFGYGPRDASYGLSWSSDATSFGEWDQFLLASLVQNAEEWGEEVGSKKASPEHDAAPSVVDSPSPVTTTKRKRRRPKVGKNEEEIKCQRMTHISVEGTAAGRSQQCAAGAPTFDIKHLPLSNASFVPIYDSICTLQDFQTCMTKFGARTDPEEKNISPRKA